jgi:GxxExxY protein
MALNEQNLVIKTMSFQPLSKEEEEIGTAIVKAAFKLHSALGPSLLEKIYEVCLAHELRKSGYSVRWQVNIPIHYDGLEFDEALRLDILVQEKVLIEVKAMDLVNSVWTAQVLSQLMLTEKRLGYLINFHVASMKEGIKRLIL